MAGLFIKHDSDEVASDYVSMFNVCLLLSLISYCWAPCKREVANESEAISQPAHLIQSTRDLLSLPLEHKKTKPAFNGLINDTVLHVPTREREGR